MHKWITLAATLTLGITACAPKDKTATADSAGTSAAVATPAAAATATATATATAPNVVTVHARDFAFQTPQQIPAGMTTIKLVNDGPNLHQAELIRLDSGKTIADLEKALALPDVPPAWAQFVGGPNAPDPGKDASATLDLKPGNYVMICMVDMPGGVPHFAKGMITPITVTPATAASAAPPAADDTISLTDYAFTLSTPVKAGSHVFEVRNNATQMHEVELVRLAPGATLKQFMSWIAKPAGPPPGSAIGGVAGFTGSPNYFSADMTPGNYALICFIPDAKDGKPHFMHGMTKTITVM